MDELHQTAPQKDFGPQASLIKRRAWGGVVIGVTCLFLVFVVGFADDHTAGTGITSGFMFSSEHDEPPSPLTFILLSIGFTAFAVGLPAFVEKIFSKD